MSIGIVILAGGRGERMRMDIPKPMVSVGGKPLIDFPINESLLFLNKNNLKGGITSVTGYLHEMLDEYLKENFIENGVEMDLVLQREQLGTAHAIQMYVEQNKNAADYDYTLILCGDTPLIRERHLSKLWNILNQEKLDAVAASFLEDDPSGYGRIVEGDSGFHIVEEKDADEEIRKISEVNSGLYIVKTDFLLDNLREIDSDNKAGEFYLTDIFKDNRRVQAVLFDDPESFMGVNDVKQLEEAGLFLNFEKIDLLRNEGVRFIDSTTCYVDWDCSIGPDSVIHPNVIIRGRSRVDKNVVVESGCILTNSIVEEGGQLRPYSVLEEAHVGKNAMIGPFARLRPGADIGQESKVGNFVEIKKAVLDKGVKVSHLSYIGDAHIGENTNLGCGFITCNYDGANKNFTDIGENCFIGSDSQMIAPLKIEDDCYVGSGSTINKDLPKGSFAVSRSKQVTYKGMARKFLKKKGQ